MLPSFFSGLSYILKEVKQRMLAFYTQSYIPGLSNFPYATQIDLYNDLWEITTPKERLSLKLPKNFEEWKGSCFGLSIVSALDPALFYEIQRKLLKLSRNSSNDINVSQKNRTEKAEIIDFFKKVQIIDEKQFCADFSKTLQEIFSTDLYFHTISSFISDRENTPEILSLFFKQYNNLVLSINDHSLLIQKRNDKFFFIDSNEWNNALITSYNTLEEIYLKKILPAYSKEKDSAFCLSTFSEKPFISSKLSSFKKFFNKAPYLNRTLLEVSEAGLEDHLDFLLMSKKIFLSIKSSDDETPLLWAVNKGHSAIVKKLLEAKADPNVARSDGLVPLIPAAAENQTLILKDLLLSGANPNCSCLPNSITPLYLSAKNGNIEAIKLLLDHKADINFVNANGYSPLSIAIHHKQLEAALFLLKQGADPNLPKAMPAIFLAIEKDMLPLIKPLISSGASMGSTYKNYTPITFAIFYRKSACIDLLLDDLNLSEILKKPLSDLDHSFRMAKNMGYLEIADKIIAYRKNLFQKTTPLLPLFGSKKRRTNALMPSEPIKSKSPFITPKV